jgi:zinc transport system substrate-binding protein
MKKIRAVTILTVLILFSITGCVKKETANSNGKISVITTIFPPYDFVRAVAGDRVNLAMLLPPAAESHSFEPTPRDIIAIQNSALFIYIGGESEVWAERILDSMEAGGPRVIRLMDTVEAVEEEIVEGMQDEEDEEAEAAFEAIGVPLEPELDEHIWTSPQNAKLMVQAIAAALCEADPANAQSYRQNAASYVAELDALDAAFREVVSGAARHSIVFADRFPFRYFADAYGLSYFADFPGCSTETEPSAATVAFLIDKVKAERIPVVFHIELSNEKMADTIAGETGAQKRLLHSSHNVSKQEFESGVTYLELQRGNIEPLRAALR